MVAVAGDLIALATRRRTTQHVSNEIEAYPFPASNGLSAATPANAGARSITIDGLAIGTDRGQQQGGSISRKNTYKGGRCRLRPKVPAARENLSQAPLLGCWAGSMRLAGVTDKYSPCPASCAPLPRTAPCIVSFSLLEALPGLGRGDNRVGAVRSSSRRERVAARPGLRRDGSESAQGRVHGWLRPLRAATSSAAGAGPFLSSPCVRALPRGGR